jgi:hypothetical protein
MATDDRSPTHERPPPVATITVGVDGRVYFHDVTPDILSVAAAMCPEAPTILDRQAAARAAGRKRNDGYANPTEEE